MGSNSVILGSGDLNFTTFPRWWGKVASVRFLPIHWTNGKRFLHLARQDRDLLEHCNSPEEWMPFWTEVLVTVLHEVVKTFIHIYPLVICGMGLFFLKGGGNIPLQPPCSGWGLAKSRGNWTLWTSPVAWAGTSWRTGTCHGIGSEGHVWIWNQGIFGPL